MAYRLLIVDDEEWVAFVMRRYFDEQSFVLSFAESLLEAGRLVRSETFDAVLTDLRLGGADGCEGLELLDLVRETNPGTLRILLTAFRNPAIDEDARERGPHLILEKPIGLAQLEQQLRDLLSQRTVREAC
ncbi:MAG: response regulator [Acidobacteria bacterium]|nr:response regulator [Acidobacteriota bacterium]